MVSKKTIILLTLFIGLCAFALVRAAAASGQLDPCHFETGDQYGAKKETFYPAEDVYVNGSGFPTDTLVDIYVVNDTTWIVGMNIPANGIATKNVLTSAIGEITPTRVWKEPLTPGKYDIIVDVNRDGKYDNCDCLEDNEVSVTAGFLVIPEYVIGTVLGVVGCLAAFGVFRLFRAKDKTNYSR